MQHVFASGRMMSLSQLVKLISALWLEHRTFSFKFAFCVAQSGWLHGATCSQLSHILGKLGQIVAAPAPQSSCL